jgi:methyltransferase (TIGR00027 family)
MMKTSTSSKTAAQMALSRAIETRRSEDARICYDPFAERFLDRGYRLLVWARVLRGAAERIIERLFPGHHHYVLCRTRHFDERLKARLAAGVEQVVILGAGFDSRAYRFAELLAHVKVFEVDHPATSQRKRAKVNQLMGAGPPNVAWVAVDFNRDSLGQRLAEADCHSGATTLFLWEGTTPYLTAEAVSKTLRFIASSSGPRSAVVFDYVLQGVIDGHCTLRGARNEAELMKRTSEPFTFGIAHETLAGFLADLGLRVVSDVGGEDLAARYLPPARRDQYVKPWWRIVEAEVA